MWWRRPWAWPRTPALETDTCRGRDTTRPSALAQDRRNRRERLACGFDALLIAELRADHRVGSHSPKLGPDSHVGILSREWRGERSGKQPAAKANLRSKPCCCDGGG